MKILALAGIMTLSAMAGSAITLSLSQVALAQDDKPDDRHWTEQHPAGAAHAQQQASQLQAYANKKNYTEYEFVSGSSHNELKIAVTNAMADGWKPLGGISVIELGLGRREFYQALVR